MGARRRVAAQRRTLLECMPRGAVFHTLSYLSFSDIVRLLCADKRLRPFANARHFAPWRKRFLKLAAAEAAYEACVRAGEESGETEDAFVAAYGEALSALQLARAPLQMHEMLHAVVAQDFDADAAQMFLVPWIMGRCEAGSAFARFAAPVAVEMLCFARVFFVVLRLSRHFSSGPSHRPYHQMVHVLDADAESALHRFFSPRLAPTPPDALTSEQAAFVAHDVRPTDLVCVQAYAGTGKTRSLYAYAQRRPSSRFLYITFNAATARAARAAFPPNVECRTMHAVALRHVQLPDGQALGTLRPRDVVKLLRGQLPEGRRIKDDARPEKLAAPSVATYILRTLDRFMQSADPQIRADRHVPKHMAQCTDLRANDVAHAAAALWDMICAGRTECPHDAYVKLLHLQGKSHFGDYTALLLDEAQDLSACQTAILLRARGTSAVVVVGDVHQKIYGFRGGSAAAFHARTYPPTAHFQLTQSFRFGPHVARLASQVLSLKAPPPWAPHTPAPRLHGTGPDAVLLGTSVHGPHTRVYRTNALLAHDALRLAASGTPRLFLKTSQAMQPAALAALLRDAYTLYHGEVPPPSSSLREFAAWKELVEHVEADDGGGDSKLALVVSLAPLLSAPTFLEHVAQLEHCCCAAPEDASIVLTTVHQAKGLEWDTVVLADDFSPTHDGCAPALRPRVHLLGACDEVNHMYVALTRARRVLCIPPGVYAWVAAREGMYRFRYAEKSAKAQCPLCRTQRVALVQLCMPYSESASLADVPVSTAAHTYDASLFSIGCLACVRARLGLDADLEDFVRWVDGCGVSTTTGRLTPAAVARTTRKHAPSAPRAVRAPAFSTCTDRRDLYAALLEEIKSSVRRWREMRHAWVAETTGPEPMETDE